ncbi:MAG: hypothetical protein Q8Q00_01970 [Dehalococcoidia bacterium]|nr:hypothetical protein [Dehalococcoidia bacterium]
MHEGRPFFVRHVFESIEGYYQVETCVAERQLGARRLEIRVEAEGKAGQRPRRIDISEDNRVVGEEILQGAGVSAHLEDAERIPSHRGPQVGHYPLCQCISLVMIKRQAQQRVIDVADGVSIYLHQVQASAQA